MIKYGHGIQYWGNNWDNLASYFGFPMEIRKIMYATDTVKISTAVSVNLFYTSSLKGA